MVILTVTLFFRNHHVMQYLLMSGLLMVAMEIIITDFLEVGVSVFIGLLPLPEMTLLYRVVFQCLAIQEKHMG